MSKVQRGSTPFEDIANKTIAESLESRLKELERNIAVAQEFIKLADETYSRVKREWDLLQHDTRVRRLVADTSPLTTPKDQTHGPSRSKESTLFKRKTKPEVNEFDEGDKKDSADLPMKSYNHSRQTKGVASTKEPTEQKKPSHEDNDPSSPKVISKLHRPKTKF